MLPLIVVMTMLVVDLTMLVVNSTIRITLQLRTTHPRLNRGSDVIYLIVVMTMYVVNLAIRDCQFNNMLSPSTGWRQIWREISGISITDHALNWTGGFLVSFLMLKIGITHAGSSCNTCN